MSKTNFVAIKFTEERVFRNREVLVEEDIDIYLGIV